MLDQQPDRDRDSREEVVGARLEAVLRRYCEFENDLSIAPNGEGKPAVWFSVSVRVDAGKRTEP